MNKKYKMVVCDLDGTLLHQQSKLMDRTIDTIIKLQQQGIRFAINTGRPIDGCRGFIDSLQLEKYHGFFIGGNGQFIKNCGTGETIENARLSSEQVNNLVKLGYDFGIITQVFYQHEAFIIIPKKNGFISVLFCFLQNLRWMLHQSHKQKVHYCFNPLQLHDAVKVCFSATSSSLKQFNEQLKQQQDIDTFLVNPIWLEALAKGVNKGEALHTLAKLTSIPVEEMVSFGDGENDIPQLKVAGLGCAMANAMENTKKVADCIVKSNLDYGVSEKLIELFELDFTQ